MGSTTRITLAKPLSADETARDMEKLRAHERAEGLRPNDAHKTVRVLDNNHSSRRTIAVSNSWVASGMDLRVANEFDAMASAGFIDAEAKVTAAGRRVGLDQATIDTALNGAFSGKPE